MPAHTGNQEISVHRVDKAKCIAKFSFSISSNAGSLQKMSSLKKDVPGRFRSNMNIIHFCRDLLLVTNGIK